MRFEDTDRERSKPEYEASILDSLQWLQFKFDETCRQSERTAVYTTELERLLVTGAVYRSPEAPVIRFRNPGRVITFTDLVRGEISFDTTELGDFIIARNINEPLYHFAVVVDDWQMGLTHVIRGEDHISNTPRQILIQEALGAPRPIYAHIPLILAPDRSKLSKRHGAVSVTDYRERGYLPEALINYLALLGWNPGTEQEIFSLTELIEKFSLEKIQKGGAVFDVTKLNWLNREYLKLLPEEMIIRQIPAGFDQPLIRKILPLLRERMVTLNDVSRFLEPTGEFGYFLALPIYSRTLLRNQDHLEPLKKILEKLPDDDFTAEKVRATIFPYAEQHGKSNVLWPFRVALTGLEKSPDPFTIADILGKKETLLRLEHAAKTSN